ncbi:hypothetical protein BD626DRAFT_477294 [Schizophyllum amplum]|uniref:Uncharacterized protein n=1 Tax=Schizophyllum amplum TaxID=97359 RepID=A0A550D027_9AGAR|nr:hypothetical protein BD626DRAFT_477294 [Auriculariopsis ampla]
MRFLVRPLACGLPPSNLAHVSSSSLSAEPRARSLHFATMSFHPAALSLSRIMSYTLTAVTNLKCSHCHVNGRQRTHAQTTMDKPGARALDHSEGPPIDVHSIVYCSTGLDTDCSPDGLDTDCGPDRLDNRDADGSYTTSPTILTNLAHHPDRPRPPS